jgi:mono/diheme cytochrome c family protein
LKQKTVASGWRAADNGRVAFVPYRNCIGWSRQVGKTIVYLGVAWAAVLSTVAAQELKPREGEGLEFFEKRVRPLFAEHCYQCHGPKKQESGLVLSTASGLREGGDRGTPIALGEPENSLLIQAIRYTDDDLKMPPRGKLKDEQIADLVAWVKLGAPLPADDAVSSPVARPSNDFNLAERRTHWAYQPVDHEGVGRLWRNTTIRSSEQTTAKDSRPPWLPWCHEPIDAFIGARLEAAGLPPSPPAEKRALIRRLTFDLTGLPPLPDEVAAFQADETPDAHERLVDRLLASPRYGERFGRHWLDVVRYSETLGFEFDYDLHNAWRYRDYVIRAFNADLPYDQFVIEHLAGDLNSQPRRQTIDGTNESILATGFWWMHEGKQTPVDIRQDQADRIDNQLDVFGKAFLGQTIACARCHDHKFDAISTRDYYALAGYLRSSRYQQAFIEPPDTNQKQLSELAALREWFQSAGRKPVAELWKAQASHVTDYLLAIAKQRDEAGLDPERLKQWEKALSDDLLSTADHPLFAWSQRTKSETAKSLDAVAPISAEAEVFEDFSTGNFDRWFATGNAFGPVPAKAGELVTGSSSTRPVARLNTGGADSGTLSNRLQGELRSQTFTINKKFLHLRLAGRNSRVNLVIDGYTLIMNPMYGKLTVAPSSDRLVWRTIPVDRWIGHRAFIEISDNAIPMHGLNPPPSPARMPLGPDGYIAIDKIVFSARAEPSIAPSSVSADTLQTADDLPTLAEAYQRRILETIERFESGQLASTSEREADIALINWLLENGLLDTRTASTGPQPSSSFAEAIDHYHALEASLVVPQRAPAFADGTGEDELVFVRGNWRTPGERAPRDVPEVLQVAVRDRPNERDELGSGRHHFARHLVEPANPLLPRVIVNRLWQHHFGEGIVRTPDDFGRMGQPPTHPELLDYLASELIRNDWSLKAATRQMVNSSTYRQSAIPQSDARDAQSADPENRFLWHMPIRRLEAEAIRDSVLAISGRLDYQMHGPSVLPHITPYMEGRGKPQSGPLDGAGRRSIYINARRNFLTPLLLAFDYPVTFTPIGRRGTATIPAQALSLMNDPFVIEEAKKWADRLLATSGSSTEQRIASLYESAFARPPSHDEIASAIDFLQQQSLRHGGGSDDPRVWTDLCHVLINVKEFIFVE